MTYAEVGKFRMRLTCTRPGRVLHHSESDPQGRIGGAVGRACTRSSLSARGES
jgi:hypothetical protein